MNTQQTEERRLLQDASNTIKQLRQQNSILSAKTEPEKNPAAVALGRLGGLKGGKARAENVKSTLLEVIDKMNAHCGCATIVGKISSSLQKS